MEAKLAVDPIEALEGLESDDGWVITERLKRRRTPSGNTPSGGHFSVGYLAEHKDGRRGFFKALDFRRALSRPDPARELQLELSTYNFERDVLELCKGARLDRVVVALTSGYLKVKSAPLDQIHYLIFELAEGDVRAQTNVTTRLSPSWCFLALHHVATGVQQLHRRGIFHQDLKPSNILVFDKGAVSKLADLGRAHCIQLGAPHDGLDIPGARLYAPPEQLYGFCLPDRLLARGASDLYQLGSMLQFLFTGTATTPATLRFLRNEHKPAIGAQTTPRWTGKFDEVLPYYRDAYGLAIEEFEIELRRQLPSPSQSKVIRESVTLLKMATEPDPRLRGHSANIRFRHHNQYGVERFISAFAVLHKQVSLRLPDARSA